MALFQKAVASAVSVPVLMSSTLSRIPLIHTLHGPGCRIGVLTAHSGSLTPEHFRQAGHSPTHQIDALAIAGMENFPVLRKTILEEGRARHGHRTPWARQIGAAAAAMTDGQPLDALLLECTDLSVFARTVQEAVFRPGLRYQFPDRLRGLLRAAEPVGVTGNRPPQT